MTIGVKRGGVDPRYMERLNRSTPASKKVKVVADRMIRPINPQVWGAIGEEALIPPKKIEKGEQPFNRIAYKELIDPTLSRVVHSVVRPLPVEGPFKPLKIRQEALLPSKSGPIHVLNALDVRNDYYSNIIDGIEETCYVALGDTVYTYCAATKKVEEIVKRPVEIRAVKISGTSGILAVADTTGISFYQDHKSVDVRASFQAIASYQSLWLLGGNKMLTINLIDHRDPTRFQSFMRGHNNEVCSLLWNDLQPHIVVASENSIVNLWDIRKPEQLLRSYSPLNDIGKTGAFKGAVWHTKTPSRLFVGGGGNDKKIHIFDINEPDANNAMAAVRTDCSVTSLYISQDGSRLISTEGNFYSPNAVLWDIAPDCSSLSPVHTFVGHGKRILGSYVYPGEKRMATIGTDESMRFWTIPQEKKKKSEKRSLFSPPISGAIPSIIGERNWVSGGLTPPVPPVQPALNFLSLSPILNAQPVGEQRLAGLHQNLLEGLAEDDDSDESVNSDDSEGSADVDERASLPGELEVRREELETLPLSPPSRLLAIR